MPGELSVGIPAVDDIDPVLFLLLKCNRMTLVIIPEATPTTLFNYQ